MSTTTMKMSGAVANSLVAASANERPSSCDTFVAFPPATSGPVIFGKNSDRPAGEGQSVRRCAATRRNPSGATVQCTYAAIPQVERTHAVLLSQIDWMWGAEMGANECGVVIGNEAVWTDEPEEEGPALLGMDLVRLGLERGATARQALDVVTGLLERHGQGGACAENDPSFTYHNSFLIADCREAWVLETAGRNWVAERITAGSRNISNGLTIRTKYDLCSYGLKEHARKRGLWDGETDLDWTATFGSDGGRVDDSPHSRQACGARLLERHDNKQTLDAAAMMEILRSHDGGICMHGGFETTASQVSELSSEGQARHWMTGQPYPCRSEFKLEPVKKSGK
jgi:secernin